MGCDASPLLQAFLARALLLDPTQVTTRLIPLLSNPLERTQVRGAGGEGV